MEQSKQILDELKSISELVANIPFVNPYHVPAAYFDNLAEKLVSRVSDFENNDANFLLNPPKIGIPYKLSGNYFAELSGEVLRRIKLESASGNEELEILSPLLLRLKKASTFKLPAQYFEEFPSIILKRIELEETESEDEWTLSPLLGQLKKTHPFKLPEGYFEEFPSDIIAGVNAVDYVKQELEAHAPIMNELKIQNVYKVPHGYFDKFGDELLNTVKHQRKAPVISIGFGKKMLRYSVAALVAGIMSIATWVYNNNRQVPDSKNGLAEIEKVSNDEMVNYLESALVTTVENVGTASVSGKEEEDARDLLADVPDEELQQYLEQLAVSKDL